MAIRHMISDPITILSPSREGRIWIQYSDGRKAEVAITELHSENGWKEINAAIDPVTASWDWKEWLNPTTWHLQVSR